MSERTCDDLCDCLEALTALVDALPKCIQCGRPATRHHYGSGATSCDEHAVAYDGPIDHAEALRKALAVLGR